MNIENISAVIAQLRYTEHFDQTKWAVDCNTPGCIAGHIAPLIPGFSRFENDKGFDNYLSETYAVIDGSKFGNFITLAGNFLGISEDQAHELFHADPYNGDEVQTDDAIAVLEILAETGYIDWAEANIRVEDSFDV